MDLIYSLSQPRSSYNAPTNRIPSSLTKLLNTIDESIEHMKRFEAMKKSGPKKRIPRNRRNGGRGLNHGASIQSSIVQIGWQLRGVRKITVIDIFPNLLLNRLYMVDRRQNGEELREEFDVIGSPGNATTRIHDGDFETSSIKISIVYSSAELDIRFVLSL